MKVLAKNNNPLEIMSSIPTPSSFGGLLGNVLFNIQKVQQDTHNIMEQLIQYYLSHQLKIEFQIESFDIQIASTTQYHTDNSTSIESLGLSSAKHRPKQSSIEKSIESPERSLHNKRYTEDDCYLSSQFTTCLNKITTDRKHEAFVEVDDDDDDIHNSGYKRNSHRTIEPRHLDNANLKEKKIRGFNFRNKIELNERNHCLSNHKKTSDSLFKNQQETYDHPSSFANIMLIDNKDDIKISKPQIVSKKESKQFWNVSYKKPNKLHKKLQENIAKVISSKRILE